MNQDRSTFLMRHSTRCLMRHSTRWRLPIVDAGGRRVVSQAGGVLLARTAQTSGLGRALASALAPWHKPLAVHDQGRIVLDLAVALALGGTTWPTSPSCGRRRRCSARSPPIPRCRG